MNSWEREIKSQGRVVIKAHTTCYGDHRKRLLVPCESHKCGIPREVTFELGIEERAHICQVGEGVKGTSGRRRTCLAEEL